MELRRRHLAQFVFLDSPRKEIVVHRLVGLQLAEAVPRVINRTAAKLHLHLRSLVVANNQKLPILNPKLGIGTRYLFPMQPEGTRTDVAFVRTSLMELIGFRIGCYVVRTKLPEVCGFGSVLPFPIIKT